MNKSIRYILVIGLISLGFLIYKTRINPDKKEIQKNFVQVEKKDIHKKRLISGILLPGKEVNLKPQISGIIEELYVQTGDQVKKGDIIAKIKIMADPASIEASEKNFTIAKINFELEKTKHNRFKELYKQEFLSESEYEECYKSYKLAMEEVRSAKTRVEIARTGYSEMGTQNINLVYSTISGVVLETPQKVGSSVTERNTFNDGTTIAVIADMKNIIFKASVTENDIKYLYKDMEFPIFLNAFQNKKMKTRLKNLFFLISIPIKFSS